jgi:F-type H+-transporting ATPase subunit delta
VQILSRLHRLVKMDLEQHAARVESAVALTAGLQADVMNEIKKKYGAGVSISFAQNPALIGGLRIQVGSDLYDGSLKMRLQKLEESF